MWRRRAVLIGCLLMAGISPAMATPPQPGTTDSGLNASEEATLWSNAPDEYWGEPSANDSVIERLATETDVTFQEPPDTAVRWNEYAHGAFEPGGVDTSVHPAEGFTYDGPYIKDAHATIFALTPSTRAFLTTDDERLYVAPEGTLRGAVDYRVDVPDGSERRSWSLRDHGIETVWLFVDDEQTQSASGTHRPTFEYDLDGGQHTVQLEARIEATLQETIRPPPDSDRSTQRRIHNRWVTVHYEQPIEVYEFDLTARHAAYSGGDDGISIAQAAPWRGYTLRANETAEIRSNWRFFTARPNRWQTLVESTEGRTTERDSHALPAAIHAYPSSTPPRATRLGGHPTRLRQWGPTHDSPAERLPEHVTVDVVNESYTAPHGIAVRDTSIDPGAVTVHGLVRGTQTELDEPDESVTIAESNLSASVLGSTDGDVRVHLRLEDASTGEPIALDERAGYIEIAGERHATNASGETTIRLDEPGVYTATYEPEPWLDTSTPYTGDSATVRWHPLRSLSGAFALVLRFGLVIVPLAALWYAGRQLDSMPRFGRAK